MNLKLLLGKFNVLNEVLQKMHLFGEIDIDIIFIFCILLLCASSIDCEDFRVHFHFEF